MPEIFRFFGFSFFFYSKEHEPPHVHVEGANGMAVFYWDGQKFTLRDKHNIKPNDLKRIKFVIDDNSDIIIRHWKKHFEKETDNEDC